MKTMFRIGAVAGLVLVGLFFLTFTALMSALLPWWSTVLAVALVGGAVLFFWLRRRNGGGPSESAGRSGKVGLL